MWPIMVQWDVNLTQLQLYGILSVHVFLDAAEFRDKSDWVNDRVMSLFLQSFSELEKTTAAQNVDHW